MFKTILITFLVILLVSCNLKAEKQHDLDLTSQLQASFGNIYHARFGLEYPRTNKTLNNCIKHDYQPCIEAYQSVKDAKETVLSLHSDETLKTTLDIIEHACLSEDVNMANGVCFGGLMTLYFYNSPSQGDIIFERVKQFPDSIKETIFNTGLYWFYNRHKPERWANYVSTLDIAWEPKEPGVQKQFVMDKFNKDINELEDDNPWVLREMN